MSEEEADKAFEVYEQLQVDLIVQVRLQIDGLNDEQKRYVVDRLHDEFRFWRAFP